MSSNKCKNCGLVNKAHDHACHRCGCLLYATNSAGPRVASRILSLLYTLIAVTLVGGAAYYIVTGFQRSYDEVRENELKRLAAQPNVSPAPLAPRAGHDRRRAESYKNAVANSPNPAASQKHNDEINKLTQPPNKQR
jgi:hypothetical protein